MGKSGTWLIAVKRAFFTSKEPAEQDQKDTNTNNSFVTHGRKETIEIQQRKHFKEKNRWSFRRSSRTLMTPNQLHRLPGHDDRDIQYRQLGGANYVCGKGHLENGSARNQNQNKQALAVAVATAAAAEAAVAAAQAAAQVVKLAGSGRSGCNGNIAISTPSASNIAWRNQQELAAIRIQAAFRAYLARRTYRTLQGLARLQALTQGRVGQKQTTATMRCMQALVRAQAAVRGRRTNRFLDDTDALGATMPLHPTWSTAWEPNESRQSDVVPTEGIRKQDFHKSQQGPGWDCSAQTIEQIQARQNYRQEAAVKRERAMAYAFAHQQLNASTYPGGKASTAPQLGWNWLERWMAAKPWENRRPSPAKEVCNHGCTPISTIPPRQASPIMPRVSAPTTPASFPYPRPRPAISRAASPARSTAVAGSFSAPAKRMCGNPFSRGSRAYSLTSSSVRDDVSVASYAGTPSYMASTESARAKLRSHSTPKQRASSCRTRSAGTSVQSDDIGANERHPFSSTRKLLSFTNANSSSARNFLSFKGPPALPLHLQRNHSFESCITRSKFRQAYKF